ncbi:MAG: hypothetical protein E7417_04460 [Ruminococcaceae bacterium]|nr:hypothetical protein [Oscillospiraceae bacterium]
MIHYVGDRGTFEYFVKLDIPIIFSNSLAQAEKLIVTEYSENAVRLIKEAVLINIPVLAILDGFQSVIKAFDGICDEIECSEGKQEWAVVDTSVPIYRGLETAIQVCRGKPVGILETVMPSELDCISRSNDGDIIAVSNLIAPGKFGNIYGLNFYISSGLTPDAEKIITNFINL